MTPPVMRALKVRSILYHKICSIWAVSESTLSAAVFILLIVFVFAFTGDSCIAVAQAGSETSSSEALESAKQDSTDTFLPVPSTDREAFENAAAIRAAAGTGNNAWVLLCSALVFFMIAPGLALFYSGLVRKKNVLSVFIQCLFITAIMSIVWSLYGYSLAFSNGGGLNQWIGGFDYVFLNGVSRRWSPITGSPVTPMWFSGGFETSITRYTHMIFQGMFFSIAPVIMCGALAERVKFHGMVAFSILWGTFVYCPIVHWIWAGGMLSYPNGLLGGGLDFAGGTVVHVSAGVSALVAAMVLGPRLGFGKDPMPPHNLTYTAIGAAMLWFGWFGFNAGSALAANEVAASAFVTTHLAAAAGAVGWWFLEWRSRGKATLLGVSSGVVAGLVCITPAAGFVQPMPALLFGFSGGVGCYFACSLCKHLAGYDDSLDAFGIHGVAGIIGAILTALFATRACNDVGQGKTLGLLEGGPLLQGQLASIMVVVLYSALTSLVLLKVVDWTIGLRVSASDERQGLDVQQHGEEGYIFL